MPPHYPTASASIIFVPRCASAAAACMSAVAACIYAAACHAERWSVQHGE